MNVVVTGGTGFTGSIVVPQLIAMGAHVRCLVRTSSKSHCLPREVTTVVGDLNDYSSLLRAFAGADILVNIASLGFGHADNIVTAAERSGIERAVFISTTALFTTLNAPSKLTRVEAERTIFSSKLSFTILRPTMIYGNSRDRNICRLIRLVAAVPLIPILGHGKSLQQPVYVEDVARAVVQSIESHAARRRAYNIPGATALTYNDMIDVICLHLRRRRYKCHIPHSLAMFGLRMSEVVGVRLPVSSEQVLRLNEDKCFEYRDAQLDFGYSPRSFVDGVYLELKQMGLA